MAKILERPSEADQTPVRSQQDQSLSNYAQQLWQPVVNGTPSGRLALAGASDPGGELQIPPFQYSHCEHDDQNKCIQPRPSVSDPDRLSLEYLNAEELGDPKAMKLFQGDLSRSLNAAIAKGGSDGAWSLIGQIDNELPSDLQIVVAPADAAPGVITNFELSFPSPTDPSGSKDVAPPMQFSTPPPTIYHAPREEPRDSQTSQPASNSN